MAKILVVEDSPVDRLIVRRALNQHSHLVREAEDPEEVFATVRTWKPDLILLDIILPKSNGYEICRHLKRNPETAPIPVIFVSSRKQKSDIYWGLKQGANDYLTKPFSESELIQRVNYWLTKKSA